MNRIRFLSKVMSFVVISLFLFIVIGFIFDSSVRDVVVSAVILGILLAGISQVRTVS